MLGTSIFIGNAKIHFFISLVDKLAFAINLKLYN